MDEKVFFIEGSLVGLIIQGYLRFKIKEGSLEEVPLGDAINTIRQVIERYSFGRDNVPVKEFLVDLRNLANDEGYALCDTGVDGNPSISICELREELEKC